MSFAVFFRSVWALPVLAVLVGACPCISKGATFIVANANDSGSGSFRQAIMDANALGGADTIIFQISGSAPFTITPLSALPGITSPAVIDGTTQPGYAGTPLIELNGTSAGGNAGLRLLAGNSTVRGLAINRFGADGIRIDGPGTNVIKGNFIGTDTSGALARGNALNGILINESSCNIIGVTN